MGFFKESKSMKYKNKDGIELNFTGNDGLTLLVKEVVSEAVKILGVYDSSSKMSMNMAIGNTKEFLKTNFNIDKERSDEWRINQFNRNRSVEDQVSTIEEMKKKVEELFGSKFAN